MTASRLRAYHGPALFSYGFRPFFLLGSIYAGAAIPIWLCAFGGELLPPSAFSPLDWHVHEMLFGYVAAIIGGFLLTAIPNWTGQLPLQGTPLATLASIWLAGRVAVWVSASIGWKIACVVDAAFLLLLAAAAAREIITGRKWSNLPLVAIVSLFGIDNVAFHVETHFSGRAEYSMRSGIALVIVLVAVVGGRIVPSFTRNWLARQHPGRLPIPFDRFDAVVIAAGAAALLAWIMAPVAETTGIAMVIAGCLHLVRLARWAGFRTIGDRLVLILHLAYAFVPTGYLLLGVAAFGFVPASAGIHAWTGGAIGTMTLAIMTRATLGHTGGELKASRGTQFLYAAIIAAAMLRICASVSSDHVMPLLTAAGIGWTLAFVGFAILYGHRLCSPRPA